MKVALNEISQSSIFVTARICLICLFILFTICGDVLVYTAFLSNNNLKTRTSVFFLSLVTTDTLMAVFVMPMEIVLLSYYPYWPLGKIACNTLSSVFVALGSASVCHLCVISVDRFLAISHPLRYSSDISSSVIVSLVFLWVFAFFSGTATYFIWTQPNPEACSVLTAPLESTLVFLVLDLLLPSVICVFIYAKIFQISRKHANRLKRTTPGWVNEKGGSFILVRKSTRTLGLLVGAFATAHLPFLVFHALDGAFEEKLPHRFYVGSVVKWLTFTSSTLNWALYGFLNREYKRALIKLFGVLGFRCWIFRTGVSPINSGVARTVSMAGKNNF